ncbi:MFS transporter [Nitrincola iocasae]|uniref:MFS transporter n=1 Tax=Nitrincola iocasae TaxID=2614693 RepID=A0A5J6LF03_9GAMM|nr:MFS transporter [Nitrincola iocasae]QEW06998.1 MFS transporter [Nitrincola iocasae]
MSQSLPYFRLSGFYLFYFALLGTLVPYWSLYLQSFSLTSQTIGLLMAMLHLSRVVAPNIWGWIADKSGHRIRVVRYGAFLTWVIFIAIFWQTSALGIGVVMLLFSFFWNAVLPQFEVLTLQHLAASRDRYSQIRLWGSVGFILAVVGTGVILDRVDIRWLPMVALMLMILIWLNTLLITAPLVESTRRQDDRSLWSIVKTPQVMVFLLIFFLVQFSHGPYYTFYSVMLQDLGYSRGRIGQLWAVGVIAEVLLFMLIPRLFQRFTLRHIMLLSLLLCSLRWMLIAFYPDQSGVLWFAQLLHAASFGSLHAVGIALVYHYFSPATQGRGQALFASAGFGAGGAAGAMLSGVFWDAWGGQGTFLAAALISMLAIVMALGWIFPEKVKRLD